MQVIKFLQKNKLIAGFIVIVSIFVFYNLKQTKYFVDSKEKGKTKLTSSQTNCNASIVSSNNTTDNFIIGFTLPSGCIPENIEIAQVLFGLAGYTETPSPTALTASMVVVSTSNGNLNIQTKNGIYYLSIPYSLFSAQEPIPGTYCCGFNEPGKYVFTGFLGITTSNGGIINSDRPTMTLIYP
jgi:hypothetical protein